jgi:hypothetical protein
MSINHLILTKNEAIISKKAGYVHKLPLRTSPKSVEILLMGRGVLNFLLAIYIFFSMIESVESVRDIPRYGDGNNR